MNEPAGARPDARASHAPLQRVELHGDVYVTLEGAAAWFHVELQWIEEVYSSGVLGRGEALGERIAIPDVELDRLAAIVRWHRHCGLELVAAIALARRID